MGKIFTAMHVPTLIVHVSVITLSLLSVSVYGHTRYQWHIDSNMRYSYDPSPGTPQGVYNWPRTFQEECGGLHQSPVNIRTDRVLYNSAACGCPRLRYRSPVMRGEFKNNGHSPQFMPAQSSVVTLSNVPHRPGVYRLSDFHFHYGGVTGRAFESQGMRRRGRSSMSAGSEHTIDGLRFEGEMHFVFYNARYRSLQEADDKEDGVVVVVLLIQQIPPGVRTSKETMEFSRFLEQTIPNINSLDANMSAAVDLSTFFNRRCDYYTYAGSTTTPFCHESVRWIIFREPLVVSEDAWTTLTGLDSVGDFNARFGNYRYTQPMNGRTIEANFGQESPPIRPAPEGNSRLTMMMGFRPPPMPINIDFIRRMRKENIISRDSFNQNQQIVFGFRLPLVHVTRMLTNLWKMISGGDYLKSFSVTKTIPQYMMPSGNYRKT